MPQVNNMEVMLEPQEKLISITEINHQPEVSNGLQDYVLVRDREHRSTKPPQRNGNEDLKLMNFLLLLENLLLFEIL